MAIITLTLYIMKPNQGSSEASNNTEESGDDVVSYLLGLFCFIYTVQLEASSYIFKDNEINIRVHQTLLYRGLIKQILGSFLYPKNPKS